MSHAPLPFLLTGILLSVVLVACGDRAPAPSPAAPAKATA